MARERCSVRKRERREDISTINRWLPITALLLCQACTRIHETDFPAEDWGVHLDFGEEIDWTTMPGWDGRSAPAMSVDQAARIARDSLAADGPEADEWQLISVELEDAAWTEERSEWSYFVTFGRRDVYSDDGLLSIHDLRVFRVLLDGRLAELQWEEERTWPAAGP